MWVGVGGVGKTVGQLLRTGHWIIRTSPTSGSAHLSECKSPHCCGSGTPLQFGAVVVVVSVSVYVVVVPVEVVEVAVVLVTVVSV